MFGSAAKDVEKLRLGNAIYVWRDGQLQDTQGQDVPLRAKSLQMFAALLSERGKILTKDRLSEIIWPETVATDESIARCIADIRKALNDEQYKIVQTYPKKGYRLNVDSVDPDARSIPYRGTVPFYGVLVMVGLLAIATIIAINNTSPEGKPSATIAMPSKLRDAVAILPFVDTVGDNDFLAASLSDDLAIHLAEMSQHSHPFARSDGSRFECLGVAIGTRSHNRQPLHRAGQFAPRWNANRSVRPVDRRV